MGDNEPAAPIIQSSTREMRRARSVDRPKDQVASEEEVIESGQRRMYKSGDPTQSQNPTRGRPMGNAVAARGWMAKVPSMLVQQAPDMKLQDGPSEALSPLTGYEEICATISRGRGYCDHIKRQRIQHLVGSPGL